MIPLIANPTQDVYNYREISKSELIFNPSSLKKSFNSSGFKPKIFERLCFQDSPPKKDFDTCKKKIKLETTTEQSENLQNFVRMRLNEITQINNSQNLEGLTPKKKWWSQDEVFYYDLGLFT